MRKAPPNAAEPEDATIRTPVIRVMYPLVRLLALLFLLCSCTLPALAQLRGHGGPVKAIAVSPDGSQVASGSFDTTVIRWSLSSGTAQNVLRFHEGAVNSVAFLGDGRLATGG